MNEYSKYFLEILITNIFLFVQTFLRFLDLKKCSRFVRLSSTNFEIFIFVFQNVRDFPDFYIFHNFQIFDPKN